MPLKSKQAEKLKSHSIKRWRCWLDGVCVVNACMKCFVSDVVCDNVNYGVCNVVYDGVSGGEDCGLV